MKLKGRNKVSPGFSMSSMTDIVSLLLVFLIITANSPDALDLLSPKTGGKSTDAQNVSVNIDENLSYFIDKRPISVTNLDSKLRPALNGAENSTITLRVEESAPMENAIDVTDMAN